MILLIHHQVSPRVIVRTEALSLIGVAWVIYLLGLALVLVSVL